MSFDKFLNKAKNLANDPKVRDKLNSDKAEKASDSVLDKAAGVAESLTKGKHTEKIQKARDAADRAVGTDGKTENEQSETNPPRVDDQRSEPHRSQNENAQDEHPAGEPPTHKRPNDEGDSRP